MTSSAPISGLSPALCHFLLSAQTILKNMFLHLYLTYFKQRHILPLMNKFYITIHCYPICMLLIKHLNYFSITHLRFRACSNPVVTRQPINRKVPASIKSLTLDSLATNSDYEFTIASEYTQTSDNSVKIGNVSRLQFTTSETGNTAMSLYKTVCTSVSMHLGQEL